MRSTRLLLLPLTVAVVLGACSSPESSTTPTLQTLAPLTGQGGDAAVTTVAGTPSPTFKPTEECSAINGYRMVEYGVGMAPDDATRANYLASLSASADTAKRLVPDLSEQIDVLVEATQSVGTTGNTTEEQVAPVEAANAAVTEWWTENCL